MSADDTTAANAADRIVGRMVRLPFTRLHRRSCGIIALGNFFDSFDAPILAAALTAMVPILHFNFVDVGLLLSAGFVGMTVGSLTCGWLSEMVGRKPVIVWTVGIFGLLSIAMAFAWNFTSLLTIRVIQGLALGGQVPVAGTLYTELLPGRARGRAYFYGLTVLVSLALLLAPLTGLAVFTLLGPAIGWHVLFGIGGLAIIVAIVGYYLLPESPRWLADKNRFEEADAVVSLFEHSARQHGNELAAPSENFHADRQPTRFTELFHGIYARRTILNWTQFFTSYFVMHGLAVWLPSLYVRVGGLPLNDALLLSSIFGGVTLAANFIWGAVADKLGRKGGFVVGYLMILAGLAIGSFAIAVLNVTAWPVLFGVSLVAGIGGTFNAAACSLYATELFPTRMRSWATATGQANNRVASFIAPTAIGALLAANLGIVSVFLLLAAMALIGMTITVTLSRETSRGVLEEVSV